MCYFGAFAKIWYTNFFSPNYCARDSSPKIADMFVLLIGRTYGVLYSGVFGQVWFDTNHDFSMSNVVLGCAWCRTVN